VLKFGKWKSLKKEGNFMCLKPQIHNGEASDRGGKIFQHSQK